MHIDNVDLNLLRPLELLLRERHVSRAAARANLTQSAMSRALARLRVACDDELLVRTPGGYELTPRARMLQDELATLLPAIRTLFEGTSFDPATANDVMRVAASDYPLAILGDDLFPAFTREAPQMSLIVTPMTPTTFTDLDQGRLDLVLTPLAAPPNLRRQPLFAEDFVGVLASSHPLSGPRLTVDDLGRYPHATVAGMFPQQTIVMDQLERLGIHATAEVRVPYFTAAVAAVRGTELIAVLPRRFAERHLDAALRIVELPSAITGIAYGMLWHPRLEDDPAHRWMRALIARVAAAATGE
ncbi:LysR family transcriptional regulator [Microbacterium luticocti]|uniref:LysR family transcriptional regulator n=1 Tax=Microbacterium luticocti TaxID=451764 RepID=UPI0004085C7C|nr:LysR family transcriptional regulator [Microbacterium luticocti]